MRRELRRIIHKMSLSCGLERKMRWLAVLRNPGVGAYCCGIRVFANSVENALRITGAQQIVIVEKADVVRRSFGQTLIEVIEYAENVRSATVLSVRKLRPN